MPPTGRTSPPLIGEGGGDIATDPSSGLVYVANRSDSISVVAEVSAGKYETVETVATEQGATALAFDTTTHRLFTLVPTRVPAPLGGARKPGESAAPGPSQLLIIGR